MIANKRERSEWELKSEERGRNSLWIAHRIAPILEVRVD